MASRRQADRFAQARHFRPPGRLMFLRPVKGRRGEGAAHRRFEAVWIDPEELVAEGMLVSPRMMADHMPDRLCKVVSGLGFSPMLRSHLVVRAWARAYAPHVPCSCNFFKKMNCTA